MKYASFLPAFASVLLSLQTTAGRENPAWQQWLLTGALLDREGRNHEAEAALERALQETATFAPNDFRRMEVLSGFALFLQKHGRLGRAALLQEQVVELLETQITRPAKLLLGYLSLAGVYRQQARYRDAERVLRQALTMAQAIPDQREIILRELSSLQP